MKSFIIPGPQPIEFVGELLAYSTGETLMLKKSHPPFQFHQLKIYQTQAGKIVAHVAFRTRKHRTERDADYVQVCASIEEAAAWLRAFDPTQGVTGYPKPYAEGDYATQWPRRQGELLSSLRLRFEQQVESVLMDLATVTRVE